MADGFRVCLRLLWPHALEARVTALFPRPQTLQDSLHVLLELGRFFCRISETQQVNLCLAWEAFVRYQLVVLFHKCREIVFVDPPARRFEPALLLPAPYLSAADV